MTIMRFRAQRCGALPLSLLLMACGPSVGGDSSGDGSGTSSPATSTGMASATTATPPADGTASTTIGPGTTSTSTGSTGDPIPDVPGVDTSDCRSLWVSQGCVSPEAKTAIMATTPLGGFSLNHAAFGADMGCGYCVNSPNIYSLVFAADTDPFSGLTPGLGVDETLTVQLIFAPFEGPLGRSVMAEMTANRDGISEQTTEALVTFHGFPTAEELGEPYEPDNAVTVAGSVTVDTEGWTVQGDFVATYCPDINQLHLCE